MRKAAGAALRPVRAFFGLFDDIESAHVYLGLLIAAAGLYGALDWWASAVFVGLGLIWIGVRQWA